MEDLYVDMALCTGCRACEVACAVEHDATGELGDIDQAEAVASIESVERGIRLHTSVAYSRFERCLHCTNPPCVDACPNSAMSQDPDLGVVYVDVSRCQACFMCGMVCPFGAITVHPGTGLALKCDGCRERLQRGERPACVEACTAGALQIGGNRKAALKRRREAAAALVDVRGRLDSASSKARR